MSDVLGQASALAGVAVGALGSYLVRAGSDRAAWRREKIVRWDTRRMETYAAYGHAVKTAIMLAIRVAAERGLGEIIEPISVPDGLAKLADAQLHRATLWEQVLLLGDPATIAAARRWHEALFLMDRYARGMVQEADDWPRVRIEAEDARSAFYQAARKDLGVAGIPPAPTSPRIPAPASVADELPPE